MRRLFLLGAVCAAVTWSAGAGAVEKTVAKLLKDCRPIVTKDYRDVDPFERATANFCLGYFDGWIGAMSAIEKLGRDAKSCVPKEAHVTGKQWTTIFVEWAERHPERHDEHQVLGVVAAVGEAFPCP